MIKEIIWIGSLLILCSAFCLKAESVSSVYVFYKDRAPSLQVLEKINEMLSEFTNFYEISYFSIEDEKNYEIIKKLGLPSTHFPFAVVVDGKYTVKINDRIVSFVHFPLFMKGIGRHEGNWSINDLKEALKNQSLFLKENILPDLDESKFTSDCEE